MMENILRKSKAPLFLLVWLRLILNLYGQENIKSNKEYPNSNYIQEQGVSYRVFDAAASALIQEGKFNQNLIITETSAQGEKRSVEMEVIYDPDYEYGMDIRYVVDVKNTSKKERKRTANYIAAAHHFSRLAEPYLVDEKSIEFARQSGDTIVFSFRYKRQNIDPYLKHIKRLKGEIFFIDDQLHRIELRNIKPLKKGVDNYLYVVYFRKPNNAGGHIVTEAKQSFDKKIKKETGHYEAHSITTDYRTAEGTMLEWTGKSDVKPILEGAERDTISQKLGWFLPLLGKPATKLGYKLPRPVGLNIFAHYQTQFMQFTGLEVGLNDGERLPLNALFELDKSSVNQSTRVTMVKGDVWLLPFLNIMGIFGQGSNRVQGSLLVNEDLKDLLELIGVPPGEIPDALNLNEELTSVMYGMGGTLAGGSGNWNLSLNYMLLVAEILEANTRNVANVITPMIGYMTPIGVNVMAGAQGQFYDTKVTGFIDLDGGNRINYQVDFEPIRWNYLLGVYKGFAKHWEISVQTGFGDRRSVTVVAGYRF